MKELKTGVDWITAKMESNAIIEAMYKEIVNLDLDSDKRNRIKSMELAILRWLDVANGRINPDPWAGTELEIKIKPLTEEEADLVDAAYSEFHRTKSHHEYEKAYIGTSDIAALIFAGVSTDNWKLKCTYVKFRGDAPYEAYIVDALAEIPEHYKEVATFQNWVRIYDDSGLAASFSGASITVYRSGGYGCIIKIISI